ncbi:hypothetical protein Tco_0822612 [Tanacetum coccineum]|uniref:Uncharacterized protein n=1 Tax=Tanacetum coccineum TaxID=301880 RepID=A0ABQ5AJU8_9ASTR
MGKGSRNKKKVMENIMYFNNGVGPSLSFGTPLTQEEAEKRAHCPYIMLKEKKDPGAFLFPIRLEGQINENALADTTEVTGRLVNVLCQVGFTTLSAKFLILEIPVDRDAPIMVGRRFLDTIRGNIDIPNRIFTTFDGLTRQTFRAARLEKIRTAESNSDDEEDYAIREFDVGDTNSSTPDQIAIPKQHQPTTGMSCKEHMIMRSGHPVPNALEMLKPWNKHYFQMFTTNSWNGELLHKIGSGNEIDQMLKISLKEAQTEEEVFFIEWLGEWRLYHANGIGRRRFLILLFNSMFEDRHQNRYANVAWVIAKMDEYQEWELEVKTRPVDLLWTTLRELIDSEDRLILDIPVDDVQRVAAQRAPRVQRA